MSGPFESEELLREALEEVAAAEPGDYVEEPWGSAALVAAEEVATSDAPDELAALALAATERVAASSELLDRVAAGDESWPIRLESLLARLRRAR